VGGAPADYGRASGSSTSGTINTGHEAANTIDSAVLPSSLFDERALMQAQHDQGRVLFPGHIENDFWD
jgi:hypothetical protein